MHTCPICQEYIHNDYAIINGENEIYHVDCLQEWFSSHNTGIMTQNVITSYDLYFDGQYDSTVPVNPVLKEVPSDVLIMADEETVLVRHGQGGYCVGSCEVFFALSFFGCFAIALFLIYLKFR